MYDIRLNTFLRNSETHICEVNICCIQDVSVGVATIIRLELLDNTRREHHINIHIIQHS